MDDIAELRSAILDLQGRLRDETQRRSEAEKRCEVLEKLAYRDPSSGLRTETYLHSRVREEIERSIRYPASTSLVTLCADKDHSHEIASLGQRLSEELRSTDQVFRLSNSGLALLLLETPGEGAQTVINRIAADLEQFIKGYGYTVTTFPVDANLAEDFLNMAIERHSSVLSRLHPNSNGAESGHANMH
jgi:GGDEF domain-containing protein